MNHSSKKHSLSEGYLTKGEVSGVLRGFLS